MLLRRCAVLYCEPRESLALDLQALLTGNGALGANVRWIALAPHIGAEQELDAAELAALGAIGPSLWVERADCERRHGAAAIAALLRRGLLIAGAQAEDGDAEAGDAEAGDARAGDASAGDAEAGDAKAGGARADDAEAGDARAGDAKAGDAKAGDVKAGDAKAGDAKAGGARAGDAKAGDAEAGAIDAGRQGAAGTATATTTAAGGGDLAGPGEDAEDGAEVGAEDVAALAHWRARDEALRAAHWRGLSATAHIFSRWHDVQGDKGKRFPTFNDLVARFGMPPPAAIAHGPADAAIPLPAPHAGPLDATLLRRYTGRHYDPAATLPLAVAARLLQRTFGAQQTRTMMPGADALKRTSPSGGGLHPIDAYLIAQRVDGIAPGLYHYHTQHHALEPVRPMDAVALKALALAAVADQDWFADAPMLVVLVARVQRTFWKYRDHAKAYRVLQLDAGHLSQTFYLLATEAGLPAFVTAGMNEVNLEHAFGFDPLHQAVMAIGGCGPAADGASPVTEFR